MNRKQLITLLVFVAILGGAGLVLVKRNKESWSNSDKLGQKLLANLPVNDVVRIIIKNDKELNLVKKDDMWQVQERGGYPANFSEISSMILKLKDMKIGQSEPIGASQLARMELEEPGKGAKAATLLDFQDSKGKSLGALLLGKKATRKSDRPSPYPGADEGYPVGRYVMLKSDAKNVMLVSDPLSNIEAKPEQWLNKDFLKVEKPKTISFVSTNATNCWKVTREAENGAWKLADAKAGEELDTNKVSSLTSTLGYPSFVDVVADPKPENTGLDKASVVTIETFDGFTYTLKFGKKNSDNNYNAAVAVSASLAKERTPGKDEKPEDKTKLDKEFADKLKTLQDKLNQEKALDKWTYLVSSWAAEPLLRDRAQMMVEKKDEKKDGASDNAAADEDSENADEAANAAKEKKDKAAAATITLPPTPAGATNK